MTQACIVSDTQPPPPRRTVGRPKHPVTLGHHDAALIGFHASGYNLTQIAAELDTQRWVIARRLRVLQGAAQ
ncbi:MAG: hypothetical protein NVS1B6_18110 [Steroidobacteraceae bacterium]